MSKSNRERFLRRIRKCLALSESSNEHEAARALAQAKAMMEQYGIDRSEAEADELEMLDKSVGKIRRSRLTENEVMLHAVICHFFGCSLFMRGNWPVIIGVAPAPAVAEYACQTLLRQLRRDQDKALAGAEILLNGKIKRSAVRQFNYDFGRTWIYTVNRKIEAFAKGVTGEDACRHRSLFTDEPVKDRALTNRSSGDETLQKYAAIAGAILGAKAELNHGVSSTQEETPRIGEHHG